MFHMNLKIIRKKYTILEDRNSVRWRGEPAGPRSSLLGRLGIRKPSLSQAAPTPRTFSLDDLLKPPTTPSPRKKRNNSTPVKKTCALSEKKEILQQLVSPVEAIPLTGAKPPDPSSSTNAETSFSATGSREGSSKLEKKVTFARLLDKVSSEMSSGSELEAPGPTLSSNSSQPGSDSRSSSETQLHVGGSEPKKGRKTASAESILAMLRGLPGVTESSTSTQAGSEDSPSSGIPDSPPLFPNKNTIQVSVMDPLSAQKSLQNLLQPPTILLEVPNKCLSPIHELPTPAPSPALTPVLGRPLPCGSPPPRRTFLKENDKPASLDLPCPPPLITVTCSMTDGESDADSPPAKPDSGGMCYLSPFSVCSRNDRTASESNLSSSGYSSMASPGPSRCGSNNPLCPTPSPLARAPCDKARRSDSETTSDDPQPESNDEGFGTEEKGEESKGGGECSEGCSEGCSLLRPPSIVVEGESPVSSRSESPLSDKTGLGRFSPMFYGRLTDSDGLYDCGGSSDCCKRKHSGRRKERRRSKSPVSQILLQVPGKETRLPERSKPSPKRRTRPQPLSSTSSSSAESLNSIRDVTVCLSSEKMGLSEDNHWPGELYIHSTPSEDLTSKMLSNEEVGVKSERKISKLRTVGHQIRFLRRLEQSLERSRLSSPERPLLEGRSAKRNSWLKSRLREVPHTD